MTRIRLKLSLPDLGCWFQVCKRVICARPWIAACCSKACITIEARCCG